MLKIRRAKRNGNTTYQRGPFLTDHFEEGRPMIITLHSTFAVLRLKGTRTELVLPFASAYTRAAQIHARELANKKIAARKAKKLTKR